MAAPSFNAADLFNVKGLVAVVTGGGTGIGLMMAQALEENGAVVYIIGRRKEVLEKAAATAKHSNIHPIQGDTTSKASLADAASYIKSRHGYLNLLIANSGTTGPTVTNFTPNADLKTFASEIWSWTEDEFNATFALNATGVFFTVAAFLELLGEGNKRNGFTDAGGEPAAVQGGPKQRSQIITTGSIAGYNRIPFSGYAYGASKAAVTHMTKQLSTKLGPYGIRANVIAPGLYPSELTEDSLSSTGKYPGTMIPEERAGQPEDMAGAVLFLASRAGAYVNGNVLVTDGGRLGVVPNSY
ncbi:NAD(P)-binding protein [Xylariomycetidae sp. FL2044]|nr:NAD(P)-binding protein [Xylariomycetidae sp. FL2044]